jgi:dihydroorotase
MDVPYPGRCKVNPPLRAPSDREALWDAVTSGAIDVLESDHAPHTVDEKDADFDSTPSGVPGVETMYPLFLALAKQGALALPTVIRLCCERPAALSGLPKGSLAVGADADFIVVDLKDVREVSHRHLHSRCGWTPFEGRPALFPTDVYLRGVPIIEGGSLAMSPGKARCVDGA